jgi:hypothetical protein
MHRRSFARALDDLHGFFDRLPQASDLCARADIKILFLDALAPRNRQRETHPVGDLAAPHRDIQFRQTFARRGDDRRLDVSTPGRRAVENDRIGRSQPAGKINRLLYGVDIKEPGTARDDDKPRRADRVDDAGRNVRRRVDEHPIHVAPLRLFQNIGELAFDRLDREGCFLAQRIPQRQRSLPVFIDQQTAPRRSVRVKRKMRGQSALARPALSGRKRKDMHTSPTEGAAADGRDRSRRSRAYFIRATQCARRVVNIASMLKSRICHKRGKSGTEEGRVADFLICLLL